MRPIFTRLPSSDQYKVIIRRPRARCYKDAIGTVTGVYPGGLLRVVVALDVGNLAFLQLLPSSVERVGEQSDLFNAPSP